MAHFYRLGAVVLLALCGVMLWTPAHASFAPSSIYKWQNNAYGATYQFDTAQQEMDWDLAGAIASAANCGYYLSNQVIGIDSGTYRLSVTNTGCAFVNRAITRVAVSSSCPADSTLSGGVCTCTAPAVQNATNDGCTAPPENCAWAAGQSLAKSTTSSTAEVPKGSTSACVFGCRWAITAPPSFWWKNEAGVYVGHAEVGSMVGTGEVCNGTEGATGDGSPASTTAPAPGTEPFPKPACQSGYIPGTVTVNGVTTTLCQPAINTENVKEKAKTEDTPDGPKTTTIGETTVCNSAGSCTTTTTTSVSVNGGSPVITTSTETEGKQQYCAKGTGKTECGTGSGSWAGNCAAGFKGDGDPVIVAMSTEIHVQNCKLNAASDESALYEAEKAKTGNRTNDLPGNQNVNVSSANFDQSNALGVGAACIGDKSIVVMGASISLPFSNICPWLENLGMVLMALSALLSARIVTRG